MPQQIEIKIKNAAQIRRAYSKAPARMTVELTDAIKRAVFLVQGRSMQNTPVLTGRLRASTYATFAPLKGFVGTDTKYDIFVHDGTKFMKARPYLANAVKQSHGDVNDFFADAVNKVLGDIGRDST